MTKSKSQNVSHSVSVFGAFLGKFAPELRAIAQGLGTVALGVALDPKDRDKLARTVDMLGNAADNIEASLISGTVDTGASRKELKEVVKECLKEIMPDIIGGIVEHQARQAAEE